MFKKFKHAIFGKPRNPMAKETRGHITLIAFWAWIALGADGLSSAFYGPEATFIALGPYTHFSLCLVAMIAITILLLSIAYNRIIELFPSSVGDYKVATSLIGKYVGLVSGIDLILGYILTITLSVVAGVDALFSLLPVDFQTYRLITAALVICSIMYINLRGIKESAKALLPIFIAFVITHAFIIIYGIANQSSKLPALVHASITDTFSLTKQYGWFFVLALLIRSFSMGAGTYTGIEAVSNNTAHLAEPRVKTGKLTMLYLAISLGFTAGGILLLYSLWNVQPVTGQTLNASVFNLILHNFPPNIKELLLFAILAAEAGLLFLGANTGFLSGAAILSNMASDDWMPHRFRQLSSQLVIKNGLLFSGIFALIILFITRGAISQLLILYTSSVFMTFTLSLIGLNLYWVKQRGKVEYWLLRLLLLFITLIICATILITIIVTTFAKSGWLIASSNGLLLIFCLLVANHYRGVQKQLNKLDKIFKLDMRHMVATNQPLALNHMSPTAVFLIDDHLGVGTHTLLWVQKMFPNQFKNFVFISVGIVNADSYINEQALAKMQQRTEQRLKYFTAYTRQRGIASKIICDYAADPVEKLAELVIKVRQEFNDSTFFAAETVFKKETWLTQQLHNETIADLEAIVNPLSIKIITVPVLADNPIT